MHNHGNVKTTMQKREKNQQAGYSFMYKYSLCQKKLTINVLFFGVPLEEGGLP